MHSGMRVTSLLLNIPSHCVLVSSGGEGLSRLPPRYLPKPFIPRKREIDDVTRGRHVSTSHGGNTATVARLFIPDWVHLVLYYFITCIECRGVAGRSECFLSSRGPLPSPPLPPLLNTKIQILNLLRELSKQNLLLFKIFVEKIAWRGPDWWDDQILTIWDSQTTVGGVTSISGSRLRKC